jgi:hypothetical protein
MHKRGEDTGQTAVPKTRETHRHIQGVVTGDPEVEATVGSGFRRENLNFK